MTKEASLDELWDTAPPGRGAVRSSQISALPEVVRRYLEHAIAPGTQLASAVRLRMHGEIKLKRWFPFRAEQVIRRDRGMIWSATISLHGIPIRGSDRLVDGEGAMGWKLLGMVPVMTASGPDITRSAAGRLQAESVWLPSVLCGDGVSWTARDPLHPRARLTVQGDTAELELTIGGTGRLAAVKLPRWGNPGGGEFRHVDFGGVVEDEDTFTGYTIPVRLRVGWYFGTDRFAEDGEFFRVTVDDATYR